MRDDPLSILALRYAARDLSPIETAAFEVRLANDRSAQDALAEAVRLSAAALGRPVPAPMTGLRGLIADRLHPVRSAVAGLFARRAYHGHPMAWAALGAIGAAMAVTAGVWLGVPPPPDRIDYAAVRCPAPAEPAAIAAGPTEPFPPPTAAAPGPFPAAAGSVAATMPPAAEEKNPMTSVGGGGGGDSTPAGNRARTFLPDMDPPGKMPDDMFNPFDPSTGS